MFEIEFIDLCLLRLDKFEGQVLPQIEVKK